MEAQLSFSFNHPSGKASIYGEVDTEGIVTFAVMAMPDSPVRGWQMFRRMMAAFGDDAKAILGSWSKGADASVNIDAVNELTAHGVSLDDAILRTWTFRQASSIGFTRVRVLGLPTGVPGAFTRIEVLMER